MDNQLGCKNSLHYTLLARLKSFILLKPPAIYKLLFLRQNNPILRYKMPPSPGLRSLSRASRLSERELAEPLLPQDSQKGDSSSDGEGPVLDAEDDPARASCLASGPGSPCLNSSCCCCCCRIQRKAKVDWIMPKITELSKVSKAGRRAYGSASLKVIDSSDDCVLGVLSCGYVVGGAGKLKDLSAKRA